MLELILSPRLLPGGPASFLQGIMIFSNCQRDTSTYVVVFFLCQVGLSYLGCRRFYEGAQRALRQLPV